MLDLVRLFLKAGDGGHGRVAFFRNRRVLKGGPVGGDGGDGGDVIIELDDKLNTLQHFSGKKKFIAGDGQRGGKARQIGKNGQDVIIKVPSGTVIWLYSENQVSQLRRERVGVRRLLVRDDLPREKYFVDKETNPPPAREHDDIDSNARPFFRDYLHARLDEAQAEYLPLQPDKLTKVAMIDARLPRLVICQGGFGGRGNDTFKSSRNTTPLEAEYGTWGEQKMVFLELKLLANVGLVGLPNAGKSTLLSHLTKARPKVADYPFTTLEPFLGVLNYPDERSLVLADIPGLIEGASEGKGLGFDFLRHLDNCRELVFVLSLSGEQVFATDIDDQQKAHFLREQFDVLLGELGDYSEHLAQKNCLIIINKIDLYSPTLIEAIKAEFQVESPGLVLISAATGDGLELLKKRLWQTFA